MFDGIMKGVVGLLAYFLQLLILSGGIIQDRALRAETVGSITLGDARVVFGRSMKKDALLADLNSIAAGLDSFAIIGVGWIGLCSIGICGILLHMTYLKNPVTKRYGAAMVATGVLLCLGTIFWPLFV